MKVCVTKRARAQIDRAARWWDEIRDSRPKHSTRIRGGFIASERGAWRRRTVLRTVGKALRLHLARIRYHLYYRIRGERIEVLALWHTAGLRASRLSHHAALYIGK